jgi:hypothetical protein|tara:strand:- start:5719 stop:6258 length:540 start_codon:yes stop_codon:yes gene_type:complete
MYSIRIGREARAGENRTNRQANMKVYPYCISTVTTQKSIENLLEASGAGSYRDEHPWIVAREFLDRAVEGSAVFPILFATGDPLRISYWSTIKRLDVHEFRKGIWQTACDFDMLREANPIWSNLDSVTLKASDDQLRRERLEGVRTHRYQLDAHHIRPYAICETPPFILALGEPVEVVV